MPCYSYVFVGHVHPLAANVTLASRDFLMSLSSENRPIQGTLNITHSAITITVPCTEPLHDLLTVKDRLQRWALITIASYGFVQGLGLDVEITKEIGVSRPPLVFVNTNAEVPRAVRLTEDLARYWNLTAQPDSRPLRLALIHYMRALREPEEAMMFCYRAIEAIRHAPQFEADTFKDDNDRRRKEWENLHAALNTTHAFVKDLETLAVDHRHGGQMIPSREEYTAGLETAHCVIERYAAYLENGHHSLSRKGFPQLKTSAFPIHNTPANAHSRDAVNSTSRVNPTVNADLTKRSRD